MCSIYLMHAFLTDTENSMRCHGCPNPMGVALKLVYHINAESTGLFSTLLVVPPKEEFGLRTQFSCPINGFAFINDDHNMEAISIVSSCLGINLGSFPILNLDTHVYIFDDCIVSPFCSFLLPTDSNALVWSTFPSSLTGIRLGYFIDLLPVSDINRSALVATFSKNGPALKVQLFNIEVSLFDVAFNTMATINQQHLEFTELVNLFDKYPAKLRGTIEQTDDWENAQIAIHGKFSDFTNNIPELLCNQISSYVEIVNNRSQSRVKNAKLVYEKAKSQHTVARTINLEREAALNDSQYLIRQTENELAMISNTIDSISLQLETANNEVRVLLKQIDDLCTIMECPDICIPKRVCEDCERNASALIQGTCTYDCTRTESVTVITGYTQVLVWVYRPEKYCRMVCYCDPRNLLCTTEGLCEIRFICTSEYIREADVVIRQIEVPDVCMAPCSEVVLQAPVTAQCCANFGCARQQQDVNCTNRNRECRVTRNIVYQNLAEEQRNATILLQSLDEARTLERSTSLRLMRHEARYDLARAQFEESKILLNEAKEALEITKASFDAVKRENQLDLLEQVTNASACANSRASYLKIQSITFNTTIITQSPMILALTIEMSIPSRNTTVSETILVDFHRFQMSLQQAAVIITENIILNRRLLSKRHARNAVNISDVEENHVHFQNRCADIENILTYLKELNASIFDIAETAVSSMDNLKDNMNEITDLIAFSSLTLNTEVTIDLEKVESITNTTVTVTDESLTGVNDSEEVAELLRLMQEHLLGGQDLANNLDGKVFQSWQSKMEFLHNQTGSAAGFPCFGFSDCLQEIVDVLSELIVGVSLDEFTDSALLGNAGQDLLGLALLQNYSIISAVANTEKIYGIASNPVFYNYWCTSPPKITVQSPQRIVARESTTVWLRCEVEVEEYTTYMWQKDCVQIPNQRGNTLVLTNVKLSDSGNYTCVVTNQVSSVTSTNSSVEVQQFPSFFLQPENVDDYLGNWNGAIFTSNATAFPFPGFRWYFRPQGTSEFTQIPGEDQNELVIVPPLPENEGSYYNEAFNEQGALRSRIVNLTVLETTVLQLAQTVHLNFTKIESDINSTDMFTIGSGASGSGFDMNISLSPTAKVALQNNLVTMLNMLMSFESALLENITIHDVSAKTIAVSFTLYSKNISYPETPLEEVNQLAPQARGEWLPVWQRLQEVVVTSEFIITDGVEEYESNPSSLQFGILNLACPPGKEESSVNNFLCGKTNILIFVQNCY